LMSKSTMAILVILFSRIIFDEEDEMISRIIFDEEDEMFSLDQWGQCPSRAATVHDGETPATEMVAEIRRVESVGSVALIVQAVTFCCGAGSGQGLCVVFGTRRRKERRRVMYD